MFNWLKMGKKSLSKSKSLNKKRQSRPASPQQTSPEELALTDIASAERQRRRQIQQIVQDHPKQTIQLLQLWLKENK